jgi:tetratricopeptide (TPR) repeat protein
LLVSLALVGATLLVYGRAVRFDFVSWDDPVYVTRNEVVRRGLTIPGVVWAFTTGEVANWHPLVTVSHMLDCQLFGLEPGGHHATNIALHAVNAVILFNVLATLTSAAWASAWVAALFAVHPSNVEAVAWVSARKDVLSAFFGFLSIAAYGAYARRGGIVRYLATAVLFALGLMAKPMLVTLPILLLLLDYWPLARVRERTPVLRLALEKLPLLALSAASAILTLTVQQRPGTMETLDPIPFPLRLANAAVSYVRYVGKLVWPTHMAVLYPHPNLPGGTPWTPWQIGGAVALLVVLTLAVLWSRRPPLLVGWLWYLVALLPVLGIVSFGFEAMADRFAYIPLIGLFIVTAWVGTPLVARWRRAGVVLAIGILVALMGRSAVQLGFWRDSLTLYTHSLDVAPSPPILHYNLANVLEARGQSNEAIRHYREATRLQPRYSEAFNNLGVALLGRNRLDEAIQSYREAIRVRPDNEQAHNNLGRAYEVQGRLDDAMVAYGHAVELRPSYVLALTNLGRVLQMRGRLDEAIARYSEALRFDPGFAPAANGLRSAQAALARRVDPAP